MIGVEFGPPKSLRLKASWNVLETANKGLFCQLITVPLFKDHKILTQVSGPRQPHHQAAAAADHHRRRLQAGSRRRSMTSSPPATRSPARSGRSARRWSTTPCASRRSSKRRGQRSPLASRECRLEMNFACVRVMGTSPWITSPSDTDLSEMSRALPADGLGEAMPIASDGRCLRSHLNGSSLDRDVVRIVRAFHDRHQCSHFQRCPISLALRGACENVRCNLGFHRRRALRLGYRQRGLIEDRPHQFD